MKIKKQVPQFFTLFVKKARASLDIKLAKVVRTKTHLAKINRYLFRRSQIKSQQY